MNTLYSVQSSSASAAHHEDMLVTFIATGATQFTIKLVNIAAKSLWSSVHAQQIADVLSSAGKNNESSLGDNRTQDSAAANSAVTSSLNESSGEEQPST